MLKLKGYYARPRQKANANSSGLGVQTIAYSFRKNFNDVFQTQ